MPKTSPQRLNTALIAIPLLFLHVVVELSGCDVVVNGECVCNLDEFVFRSQLQSQGKAQYNEMARQFNINLIFFKNSQIVGIVLAVTSGLLIGSSFVFKKKGLLRSQAGGELGEGVAYLKSVSKALPQQLGSTLTVSLL